MYLPQAYFIYGVSVSAYLDLMVKDFTSTAATPPMTVIPTEITDIVTAL